MPGRLGTPSHILTSAAALQSVDFAWVPSYFDDDDGDFLPLLLSEQSPALLAPVRDWTPVLIALAAILTGRLVGRVRPAATPARFHAVLVDGSPSAW